MPHPIIRSTTKMIAYLFILYNIREDIRQWAKHRITCQANKIHKLTRSPLSAFTLPDDRFCHIHVDISGRPPTPPHIFSDTSTENVVRKLVDSWISIFGVPIHSHYRMRILIHILLVSTTEPPPQFKTHRNHSLPSGCQRPCRTFLSTAHTSPNSHFVKI